jgi:hypothetical protein
MRKATSKFWVSLLTTGALTILTNQPCYAGCLCDLVAIYARGTGTWICFAMLACAVTGLIKKRWAASAQLTGVGAIVFTLGFFLSKALEERWTGRTPGVIANSGADIASHWLLLLVSVTLTTAAMPLSAIFCYRSLVTKKIKTGS